MGKVVKYHHPSKYLIQFEGESDSNSKSLEWVRNTRERDSVIEVLIDCSVVPAFLRNLTCTSAQLRAAQSLCCACSVAVDGKDVLDNPKIVCSNCEAIYHSKTCVEEKVC
jgi:hypothetical protein